MDLGQSLGAFVILDTTFLIDLQRETGRGQRGAATSFREQHRSETLNVSAVTARYATRSRTLRTEGIRMGDNDLWIAATAREAVEPLVTRDAGHFRRVPGLDVRTY